MHSVTCNNALEIILTNLSCTKGPPFPRSIYTYNNNHNTWTPFFKGA